MTHINQSDVISLSTPRITAQTAGILLMVLAMALVPMIDVQAKLLLLGGISAFQVVFLRMFCGSVLLTPIMILYRRNEIIPPQGISKVLMLGGLNLATGFLFFQSLKYIPIADAVAISFVQPLFVVLLSRFILREHVGLSRWVALIVGFAASILIIRPGPAGVDPGGLLALASGFAMASYAILVKATVAGARRVSPVTLTYQTHFVGFMLALPLVLFSWEAISLYQWLLAFSMASFGLAGQYFIIKAYQLSDASLVAPFVYLEIVTSTIFSWLFFNDLPDAITFIGVAILIISSLFLIRCRTV